MQVLFINIDDSGKISLKEEIAIYGGVSFISKDEKDKFITQYRSIVNDLKCRYCKIKTCNQKCPELKHSNLKNADKRRLINYIKKYFVFACIINNKKLYPNIINDKASKGRYNDYALRRLIKGLIVKLIKDRKINPYDELKIILNIDEQSTKTNGYYTLKDGLFEELKFGIINFNYAKKHQPIILGDLKIVLTYLKSDKSFVVQAADLIAGTTRKRNIYFKNNPQELLKSLKFANFLLFLPEYDNHKKKSSKALSQLG